MQSLCGNVRRHALHTVPVLVVAIGLTAGWLQAVSEAALASSGNGNATVGFIGQLRVADLLCVSHAYVLPWFLNRFVCNHFVHIVRQMRKHWSQENHWVLSMTF